MMEMIDISICIFAYNNEKYIVESIESVRRQQTKYQIELIVFDDCSTDNTVDVIRKEYNDNVCIVVNNSNVGYCKTLYSALSRIKGRYFYSLAGDDYLCSSTIIDRMVCFLDTYKKFGSVSGWNYIVNNKGDVIGQHRNVDTEYCFLNYLLGKHPNCYDGVIRVFWNDSNVDYTFLTQGAKNNEELLFWTLTLENAPKAIIQDYFFSYRYIAMGTTNYNSKHGNLDILKDNYKNIVLMRKKRNYNYDGLVVSIFCGALIDTLYEKKYKSFFALLSILNLKDKILCIQNAYYYHKHNGCLKPKLVKKIERCISIDADKNV